MNTTNKIKKLWLPIGIGGSVLVIFLVVLYLLLPCQYFSIDVNPSIELKINRLNQVVEIKGANEDAQMLLDGYNSGNRGTEEVVSDITDLLIKNGYFTSDKKNNVLITMSEGGSAETLENLCMQLNNVISSHRMTANITSQVVAFTQETINAAEENGMSAGKMSIIERLMVADPSLTTADLSQISVSDLLNYAKTSNLNLQDMKAYLDTAEKTLGDSPELDKLEDGIEGDNDAENDAKDKANDLADAEKEAREKAEDEAKEAREKAEDEAKVALEKAEDDAKEAREKAEDEAKEAREKAEDEAKEAREKAEDDAKEAREKAEDEAKEALEKAEEDDEDATDVDTDNNDQDFYDESHEYDNDFDGSYEDYDD